MSNPILPPPGFMEPIEEDNTIPRTHWEERFDLALIDECVRKVASGPMEQCPACGIIYAIVDDKSFIADGRCDLCQLFYPVNFAIAYDLNLKEITPMTRGTAYSFKCGCVQSRTMFEVEVVMWTMSCAEHNAVVMRMKAGMF